MIRRRDLLSFAALVATAPASGEVEPRRAPTRDLMPAFFRAVAAAMGAADPVKVLWTRFFTEHPADYAGAGLTLSIQRVARWWPKCLSQIDAVRGVSDWLPIEYLDHRRRFVDSLPSFRADRASVVFLPSLGAFDGHLEPSTSGTPLYIGPDGVVMHHGARPNLSVLLDHEGFHQYQAQANPGLMSDTAPPLFVNLWIEGLATLASRRLNPSATVREVLLDDERLAAVPATRLPALARLALGQIDAADERTIRMFFDAGYVGEWPARTGYLLGLQVWQSMGENATLDRLATVDVRTIRRLTVQALSAIASERV